MLDRSFLVHCLAPRDRRPPGAWRRGTGALQEPGAEGPAPSQSLAPRDRSPPRAGGGRRSVDADRIGHSLTRSERAATYSQETTGSTGRFLYTAWRRGTGALQERVEGVALSTPIESDTVSHARSVLLPTLSRNYMLDRS